MQRHRDAVARADEVLAGRLSDPTCFGDHSSMDLCDEVFSIVKRSIFGDGGGLDATESSSVLLLGEASSGKTHAVEWCIKKLQEAKPTLKVLRAYGKYYATDVECVRHLATQVAGDLVAAPRVNASFEQGMDWLRKVLCESFRHASAAVIVLDGFEHFCSRARQTLLYNLFDIAQDVGVCLSIIGMSEKMDVTSMLEKRIKSRFSMRHLHSFLPTTMDDLIQVLMSKLRLPTDADFKAPFVKEFHRHVEAALRARAVHWQPHLDLGRPPLWFLWQCLPVHALLHDAAAVAAPREAAPSTAPVVAEHVTSPAPPAKRARLSVSFAMTEGAKKALLLASLAEVDLIILIALHRLQAREVVPTLSRVLYEVQLLHDAGGLVANFDQDRYCAAFERLQQMRLVKLAGSAGDTAKRYVQCHSLADRIPELVQDLERSGMAQPWNPLRALPQSVQQWAGRQRQH